MNKIFPPMYSRPQKYMPFVLGIYGIFSFFVFPFLLMPLFGAGLWETPKWIAWLEIVYHVLNGIIVASMLSECLKDGWFMLTLDRRSSVGHIALTVGLMAAVLLHQIFLLFVAGYPIYYCFNGLPVVEKHVALTPYYLAEVHPIAGAISMVIFSPIAVCGLFYALSFAPLCVKEKPVLAYLSVVVITAIPFIIDILWRQDVELNIMMYVMQLPAHLIACWSYQKTDNIWTPIISLAIVNLLASLVAIFL